MIKLRMKSATLLIFISLIFMSAAFSFILFKVRLPVKMPSDFNFIFSYGVGAKNQIDTSEGNFIKDMIMGPSITAAIKLSDEEMYEIYSLMKDINILSYPDNYNPKTNVCITPFSTYSIKITVNRNVKSIYWEDEQCSESKKAVQLRNLLKK